MTQMTINGKRVSLSVEAKAALLTVFSIHEEGRLAVTSGSTPTDAYVVRHDGQHSQYCPCGAYTAHCAHRVAVDSYLDEQRQMVAESARCNFEMSVDPRFV
jgi:aerobic-type carbon monoxide dehydrogenase small subunit (CoxS/CutS family)